MKKSLFIFLILAGGTFYSAAQEKSSSKLVRTEANGIQVYEATGNETVVPNELVISPTRTINDWNMEECENALYFIDLKIEKMKENEGNENQILEYEAQKVLINERMNSLTSKK